MFDVIPGFCTIGAAGVAEAPASPDPAPTVDTLAQSTSSCLPSSLHLEEKKEWARDTCTGECA